jgi:predicted nucleic acid binding AN1-type Zn finger protein
MQNTKEYITVLKTLISSRLLNNQFTGHENLTVATCKYNNTYFCLRANPADGEMSAWAGIQFE